MAKATKTNPLDGQAGAGAPGGTNAPSAEDAQRDLQNELDEAAKQKQQELLDAEWDGVDPGANGNTDGTTQQPANEGNTTDGQAGAGAPGELPMKFEGAATSFSTAEESVYPVFTIIDDGAPPSHASISNAAENEFMLSVCKMVVSRAHELEYERNKPTPLSIDEMAAANMARLQAVYGKDFITAKRGTNQQYFSRSTWNNMGNNKYGWTAIVTEMPEVAEAKAAGTID